jgi:hypothetical protein
MMDGKDLFPDGYHPISNNRKSDYSGKAKRFTRTQRPPKYYLIDFGLSCRYKPEDGALLELPILGCDKSVPEFQKSPRPPSNPFPADVYYVGNMIREDFTQVRYPLSSWHLIDLKGQKKPGFEFMIPLVADMVQDDPLRRPSMDEVVSRFEDIRRGLSSWKLRSRVYNQKEHLVMAFFHSISHWTRRIGFIINRVPSVPSPL